MIKQKFELFLFLAVYIMLFPQNLSAQDKSPPVTFHGSTKLYGQYSNRQGTNQRIPASFFRWDFNSTLTLYGIPLDMKFLVSSEQSGARQNMQRFSLSFASSKMKRKIPVLSSFSKITLGTCTPSYSSLTLGGISLTGADVEFTPGLFYLAVTGGQIHRAVEGTSTRNPTYARTLYGGKIGIGKKQDSHLHLTVLYFRDDENSVLEDTITATPKENYVAGAEARLVFLKKRLHIQGEYAASLFTRDVRSPKRADDDFYNLPPWLIDLTDPNISSSVDHAYRVKTSIDLSNTNVSAEVKRIGPGFTSLGLPYMRNDELIYEARLQQRLWKRQVSITSYFKRTEDNLIPWKWSATLHTAYGINVGLRVRKYPYLQLNYAPFFQSNDAMQINNQTSLFSVTTGYDYSIRNINCSTNFFFSTQKNKTQQNLNDYSCQNYSLNEKVSFRFPLTLSGSISLSRTEYSGNTRQIFSFDVNGTYCVFKKWQNTFGLRCSGQERRDKKTGFYIVSSFPVPKIGDIKLHAEQNFLRADTDPTRDYDEFILRITLSKKW